MKLMRMFSTYAWKGTKNYLNTQKKYEAARTVLYFGLSLGLFFMGLITVKSRLNLLTVVAVLGCLPASRSAVQMVMYLRCRSLSEAACAKIEAHSEGLFTLYDMMFTSYEKNFSVGHMALCGNTLIGFTEDPKFDEKAFYGHIDKILKKDRLNNISVKIFRDLRKYTERLSDLRELEKNEALSASIAATLKSVSL